MSTDGKQLLVGIQALLGYHHSIGISEYPRSAELSSFLEMVPPPGREAAGEPQPLPPVAPVPKKKESPAVPPPVKLSDIAAEVSTCSACSLHKERLYPVPGSGPGSVRLLLVGDWLSADEKGQLPPGHLFGVSQDEMLSRMLLAIKLSATEVFVTNVIKCAVPVGCQPQASHVASCVSYLRRQIVALQPEVICTMGPVAARTVLESAQSLSRLRGRFHNYQVEETRAIPVIATYHPGYLLDNPEMKQATWADLQQLAKKLGLN